MYRSIIAACGTHNLLGIADEKNTILREGRGGGGGAKEGKKAKKGKWKMGKWKGKMEREKGKRKYILYLG